jgi:hypothetical protein
MNPIFGEVNPPPGVSNFPSVAGGGLTQFLNIIFRTLIVVAGLYAIINLIIAGYMFMSAGDDTKRVAGAWSRIWQTLLGLGVAAGAFVLAAIFGRILFGSYTYLLQFRLFGPQ